MNGKKFIFLISCICLVLIIAYALYIFITEKRIKMSVFFFACLIISSIVNQVTWGDADAVSKESQDELGKHISYLSYKIGYFVLIIVMFITLVIGEGKTIWSLDNVQNSALYLALCASLVIVPITEFFVSKKFK
ncbi:hypothetical protein [Bacillus sp. SRB_331]|uniref:hypothetical protein n=1 Tax=Bacillus sp. SRB_331 TaxID=1969379 RepID=UPI000DC2F17C|nr:hypothetical protein [Bacillus sp. SRB_331]RAN84854.1 hypothetical protein B5P42_03475 [Bacillus sp. SRB_331]